MVGPLLAMVCAGAIALHAYRSLRDGGPVHLPVAATLLIVAAVPAEFVYGRIVATVASVCFSMKLVELGQGRVHDRAMLQSPGRFFYWFFLPPDSRPARDAQDAACNRQAGRRRIARSLPKAVGVAALFLTDAAFGVATSTPWLGTLWSMSLVYLAFSGLVDGIGGASMQTGHWLAESFHAPLLARSPRDFWGRRWNMVVHRFAQRSLFFWAGGHHHPLRAIALIFAASGLMHEYLVVAVKGVWPDHLGWMLAFFGLQGLAVIGQVLLERTRKLPNIPGPLAVLLHLVWMTATAPLFLAPLGELFA